MGGCPTKEVDAAGKPQTWLLQTLDEHEGGVNCMALSEDGSVLATGSEDRTARLWTTKTDYVECIGILKGHEDYINAIVIEDNYCITGSADKTIKKWDMSTCDCVHTFKGHTSLINRIICTGDFIFTSSYDRTARCWDFDTGECIRVFSGHKRGVYPLIFIPADEDEQDYNADPSMDWEGNKDLLITGSADFTAKSWSFETGRCLQTFREHTGAITCMSTDALGKVLYTGATDGMIRSWNILKGERLKLFPGHQASIICMTVVNNIMYTGSSDHTGRSWVTEYGECTRVYRGHKHTVACIKVHNGLLYTGCGDGNARIYDAKSATLKRTLTGHYTTVNSLQIVEGRLFTGSHDATLRVWDITGITEDKPFGTEKNDDKDEKKPVESEKPPPPQGDINQNEADNRGRILIGGDDDGEYEQHPNQQQILID